MAASTQFHSVPSVLTDQGIFSPYYHEKNPKELTEYFIGAVTCAQELFLCIINSYRI